MKVFIVFLGLLLVNISFLCYQGDLGRYIQEQAILKAAAEECAAGAALLLEEEAYGQGLIIFDKAAGRRYADAHLAYTMHSISGGESAYYHCALSFEYDECGYGADNALKRPAVTAEVRVRTEDRFRLPMLTVTDFQRESRYELVY